MDLSRAKPLAHLSAWFHGKKRKPLVIRGARQVGKSTLVRHFARQEGLDLAEVNLERWPQLSSAFASMDPSRIVRELEAQTGRNLGNPKTLLFLDEIQACPSAVAALRYLYEERPKLAVVSAGSLLEFVLADHEFSMPVGRIEYFHLGPLGFGEFLSAVGEDALRSAIESWEVGDPWTDAAHGKLLDLQRQFLLVGGLPEAIVAYAESGSLQPVAAVLNSIAATYQDDFSKYGKPTHNVRLRTVFSAVAGAVGQKTKYSNLSRDDRARDVAAALDLLALARVIWKVHHSDCSGIPIEAEVDAKVFKCLFLDVGLLNRVLGLDWSDIGSTDPRDLVNEGGLAEQFIGQHLLFRSAGEVDPTLCYWLREGRRDNAEVDYVISRGRRIVPVEVKAGAAGRLRSLHQFVASKLQRTKAPLAVRFDLNKPSLAELEHNLTDATAVAVRYQLLSLPLYFVEQTLRLIQSIPG